MKEIGSIFELSNNFTIASSHSEIPHNIKFFSLCREALFVIASQHRNTNKTILLPAYTCESVIKPFVQEGWEILFYNINIKLRIDVLDLIQKYNEFQPAVCLFHPYFGYGYTSDEVMAINQIKRLGGIIIEDRTQGIFLEQKEIIFDYIVGSLRKWFPIPDGSFLIGNIDDDVNVSMSFKDFFDLQYKAMKLRTKYFQTYDTAIKEESIILNKKANSIVDNQQLKAHEISKYSMNVLSKIDYKICNEIRMNNFIFLFKNIPENNYVIKKIAVDLDDIEASPLYFPVFSEHSVEIQMKLAHRKIYVPLLWHTNKYRKFVSNDVDYIYNNILAIPCDQRYNLEDMSYIANSIEEILYEQ